MLFIAGGLIGLTLGYLITNDVKQVRKGSRRPFLRLLFIYTGLVIFMQVFGFLLLGL